MKIVTGPAISSATDNGFLPGALGKHSPMKALAATFGSQPSDSSTWKTSVSANQTSDWGLCQSCFSEFTAFEQKQKEEQARRRAEGVRRAAERLAEEEQRKPIMERHFDTWDYQAVQELERLCRTLPILPRERALAFFKAARKAADDDGDPMERQAGNVFDSLMGVVTASDRKDFSATWELETQTVAQGVFIVETYDSVIGTLYCVARVSENSFLTRAFTQRNKEAVKRLCSALASDPISPDSEVEVGRIYEGTVLKLLDFGAIVSLPGTYGLLHITQISNERINAVADLLKEGQTVRVKVIEADDKGRLRLSMKAAAAEAQSTPKQPASPRAPASVQADSRRAAKPWWQFWR